MSAKHAALVFWLLGGLTGGAEASAEASAFIVGTIASGMDRVREYSGGFGGVAGNNDLTTEPSYAVGGARENIVIFDPSPNVQKPLPGLDFKQFACRELPSGSASLGCFGPQQHHPVRVLIIPESEIEGQTAISQLMIGMYGHVFGMRLPAVFPNGAKRPGNDGFQRIPRLVHIFWGGSEIRSDALEEDKSPAIGDESSFVKAALFSADIGKLPSKPSNSDSAHGGDDRRKHRSVLGNPSPHDDPQIGLTLVSGIVFAGLTLIWFGTKRLGRHRLRTPEQLDQKYRS